jgi:putative CocE/NonD family hydrolase
MSDEIFATDNYIRVYQDVRGKYGSEGDYVMNRPVIGQLNPTKVDHVTDAYDTIDWLVKNLPESNGKVGMVGSSYEGFTVAIALLNPHPALKVAMPESPMVDGWMGDDWFQYGAFRQSNFDYFTGQTSEKGDGKPVQRGAYDDYDTFRRAGSAGDFAKAHGLDVLPFWQRVAEHPTYDLFWQGQAVDKLVAERPSKVPTMWLQGLWDQEDIWGAIHCYTALKDKGYLGNNYLAIGPWRHSQVNYEGYGLGPLKWEGDTAAQFRREVLKPFFDQHLKDGAPKANTPKVFVYNTGENRWDRFASWPQSCDKACKHKLKPLYLQPNLKVGFNRKDSDEKFDEYVSDPAKPVPYVPRPVRPGDREMWQKWLVMDQRFVEGRPDVLSYESDVLDEAVSISGMPLVELFASTSGTDSDWAIKLIDVYPAEVASQPEMGGYQLPISLKIFRGRYRESFENPSAIPANKVQRYSFELTPTNHVFKKGHRIMVQIQSTLFPLYDRNPQTFVPNIFWAKPGDYKKATQRVYRSGAEATAIWLPVVE